MGEKNCSLEQKHGILKTHLEFSSPLGHRLLNDLSKPFCVLGPEFMWTENYSDWLNLCSTLCSVWLSHFKSSSTAWKYVIVNRDRISAMRSPLETTFDAGPEESLQSGSWQRSAKLTSPFTTSVVAKTASPSTVDVGNTSTLSRCHTVDSVDHSDPKKPKTDSTSVCQSQVSSAGHAGSHIKSKCIVLVDQTEKLNTGEGISSAHVLSDVNLKGTCFIHVVDACRHVL